VTELVKELDGALAILSSLSASGGAVDLMAAAKAKIRRAIAEVPGSDSEKEGGD